LLTTLAEKRVTSIDINIRSLSSVSHGRSWPSVRDTLHFRVYLSCSSVYFLNIEVYFFNVLVWRLSLRAFYPNLVIAKDKTTLKFNISYF